MTPGECEAMLAIAGKVYGRDVSDGLVDAWAEFMADLTAEEGARAIREHVTESPHFPTVADVRRRVAAYRIGTVDPGAAWEEVRRAIGAQGRYRNPTWSHPAITAAVNALGWVEICNTMDDDLSTLRAQFERYYRAAMENRAKAANSGALAAHYERQGGITAGEALARLLAPKGGHDGQ